MNRRLWLVAACTALFSSVAWAADPAPVIVPLPPDSPAAPADALPGPEVLPGPDTLPGPDALPGPEKLPGPETLPTPEKPAEAAPPAAPPPAAAPPPPRVIDPVWAQYDQAFTAAMHGHEDEAIPLLRRLVSENAGHLAVPYAQELLRLIEARLTRQRASRPMLPSTGLVLLKPPVSMPPPRTLDEFAQRMRSDSPSNGGQVTLVLGQTINGIALGVNVCFLFGCDQPGPVMLSVLGGATLGLSLSFILSGKGITVGHALALSVGSAWGAMNAGMTLGMLKDSFLLEDAGKRSVPLGFAVGQVVGTLIGEIAFQVMRPGDGDVWAAASMSGWAMAETALFRLMLNPVPGSDMVAETLLAADFGLALGGFIAMVMPMSSGRVWVINAGGLLGSLSGLVVAALAFPSVGVSGGGAAFASVMSGSVGIGTLLGLGLTAFLSRNMDVPSISSPHVTLIPTSDGGVTPGLAMRF